jgi:hypothetical protein
MAGAKKLTDQIADGWAKVEADFATLEQLASHSGASRCQ